MVNKYSILDKITYTNSFKKCIIKQKIISQGENNGKVLWNRRLPWRG